MSLKPSIQCVNCGTVLDIPDEGAISVRCSVCQLLNDINGIPEAVTFSRDGLEHRLAALIKQARASGLTSEEIVSALRDELEFAAELAHFGRHICVQIIDLGPQEVQGTQLPLREQSTVLRGRAVGE